MEILFSTGKERRKGQNTGNKIVTRLAAVNMKKFKVEILFPNLV